MTELERQAKRGATRLDAAIAVALVLLCLLAFHRVLGSDFVQFDDDIEITTNPHIRGFSAENVQWMFTDTSHTQRYTPLSWVVWTFLYNTVGLDATAFHAQAALVHAANAALLFWVIRTLLARMVRDVPKRAVSVCAGLGAALWALHPMRVEVVSWATQVRFAESTFFALLSVRLYVWAVDRSRERPGGTMEFWLSVACYAVSVLFYPNAIGLAALLPLLDVYPLRRGEAGGWRWRSLGRFYLEKWAFFVPALFVGGMTIYGRVTAGGMWGAAAGLEKFGVVDRVMQAAYVFIYYLWKPFDPWHISAVYTQLVKFNPWTTPFVLSAAGMLVLTGAAVWFWRTRPWVTVLWMTHLALIFPMGGYFEHPHYPSDRYSYMQGMLWGIGVAALLAWAWTWTRGVIRWAPPAFVAVLVLAFGMLSLAETGAWRNGETLFRHILAELGDDPYRVHIDWRLARVLLAQGRFAEAVQYADETLAEMPRYPLALQIKGGALFQMAEGASRAGVRAEDTRGYYAEAAKALHQALSGEPDPANLLNAAVAYERAGMLREALALIQTGVKQWPGDAKLHLFFGKFLYEGGQKEAAMDELEKAIRLSPGLKREDVLRSWEGRGAS